MRGNSWKRIATEGWAFIAIAVLAFVGGFLVGDLGASPETKTVYLSNAAGGEEDGEAAGGEASEESTAGETAQGEGETGASGAQLFTSVGCGGCHTLSAAGTSGTTGPNLDESLAPDDDTAGIEEMIVQPNVEVVEGYPANVMPQSYGQTLSKPEIHILAEYLVASTPAKPNP